MRWGCHFIICGSLIFVLDRIFGCVQCFVVNNKVFDFQKKHVCFCFLYSCTATAIAYMGIRPAMIEIQTLLLWFFSHKFMDTRNILLNRSLVIPPYGQVSLNHSTYQGPSLRTHQLDKYDYPLSMRTYLHLGGRV